MSVAHRGAKRSTIHRNRNAFAFVSLLITGAGVTGQSPDSPSNPILIDTAVALERSTSALAAPNAQPSQVLQSVLTTLPGAAPAFVRTAVGTFLQRLPSATDDFNCGTDFLLYQTRQEILRIKDRLLDANPLAPEPHFCSTTPFAIDLTRGVTSVEIYGYDLDRQPIEAFLLDESGYQDITAALIPRSHFHVMLNLADASMALTTHHHSVALAWGHLIRYWIPVVHPAAPVCESRIEKIAGGKTIQFEPPSVGPHAPCRARESSATCPSTTVQTKLTARSA